MVGHRNKKKQEKADLHTIPSIALTKNNNIGQEKGFEAFDME